MALKNSRGDRERAAYRENPNDLGVDRRVADLDAHDKLDAIVDALDGVGGGEVINTYNDISSVAAGTATIATYIVPIGKTAFLQFIEATGSNVSEYEVTVNGSTESKKRSYFTEYNVEFEFARQGGRGLELSAGDTVLIRVTHGRPMTADYEARIQVYEADV